MKTHLSLDPKPKRRAIAYYRHSAEDKQENSVPIQKEHTEKFAKENDIEIIHFEADEGKSGLLADRPGFKRLFVNWIRNPAAPAFDYILVLDVSRWGRFQDQNEAAHYEYECKLNGKKVIYISRGFPKEERQLLSHLQNSVERYMAAEYSRQLSDKVFYGCVKVSEQGFSAGGTACYGMARQLLDENKNPIRILEKGEHKQISNQRVTFVPRNDHTTKAVQTAFHLLVNSWGTLESIAEALNADGIRSANGGLWNRSKILNILLNETYTGTRIYNKTWGRLKQQNRQNPRNEWVITPGAFPAVVDQEVFAKAQEHLYWLLPTQWRRGIRKVNRVRTFLRHEIRNILTKQTDVDDFEANRILSDIPAVFSVRFYRDSVPHWCFVCSESLRQHQSVLGVSIVLDQQDPIDKVFVFPTEDFTSNNTLLLSETDERFKEYLVPQENIQTALQRLINQSIQSSPKLTAPQASMQLAAVLA